MENIHQLMSHKSAKTTHHKMSPRVGLSPGKKSQTSTRLCASCRISTRRFNWYVDPGECYSIWHMCLLFDCSPYFFPLSPPLPSVCVCLNPFIPPSGAPVEAKDYGSLESVHPWGQKTRQGEVMKDKQLAANTC